MRGGVSEDACRRDAREIAISAPPRATSRKVGLPGLTVRAASKPSRIAVGQAPYFRSDTRKVVSTYSAGSSPAARMRWTI